MVVSIFHSDITLELAKDVSSAIFIMSTIFCGFLATSLSILFSLGKVQAIETMKTSGAYHGIINYLWEAILWNFGAILFSLLNIFLTKAANGDIREWACILLVSTGCGAFFATFRISKLFVKTLRLI